LFEHDLFEPLSTLDRAFAHHALTAGGRLIPINTADAESVLMRAWRKPVLRPTGAPR
jgi:hypothetical protein